MLVTIDLSELKDSVLLLGDCIEGLRQLPDKSIDHFLTDPPYAPTAIKNARSSTMIKRRDGEVYDFGYAALTPELRWLAAEQMGRLARRWVVVWCDLESVEQWKMALELAGLRFVRTGVWVRTNGCPQFSGDRPAQGAEACVIAHAADARLKWNGGGKPAAWVGPIVNTQDSGRFHASPKPLWLMRQLVNDFTDTGDLICDPFAGSASVGAAALEYGRRFLGWEANPQYHAAAIERLAAIDQQPLLIRPRTEQLRLGDIG